MNNKPDRRLIEEWLPINELSVDAIREGGALAGHPPLNQLHVWWARRPLILSRAAVAASLLQHTVNHDEFISSMGTSRQIVVERRLMDALKAKGEWSNVRFSNDRAFKHNLTANEKRWLQDNLITPDPLVLDSTAGGGSIPFESGRLGLRAHANDLNPVSAFILWASCQWPQEFGYELLNAYDAISRRFRERVAKLLQGVYPEEPQPAEKEVKIENSETARAQRYAQTYLWARAVSCPSCKGSIPLSPNWRLDAHGTGVKLIPDIATGHCTFAIVDSLAEQSPGTVKNAIATCPFPNCGATTERGYISEEAQAGQLGQQLYCVIYRDEWPTFTKAGKPSKRPKTRRGFRTVTPDENNTDWIAQRLEQLKSQWDDNDILPNEAVPDGNDNRPHNYGMSPWRNMFSPRQQLAHGYCVQAFRELVDEDRDAGLLDSVRKAAYGYLAQGLDKLIQYNSLLTRWHSRKEIVVGIFDSHDFGMKWSYAEMAITIRGLGLDWALKDLRSCISELVAMSGHVPTADIDPNIANALTSGNIAKPAEITNESADLLLSLDNRSVDAIVFDPPYYDNVNYAELSDFFYVWLKRTAGYVYPEWFSPYLTDKVNEAIASPVRFRSDTGTGKRTGSVKRLAYEDYLERMRRIFAECRRVVKDDGIVTIMFTHKSTDAWDALTVGIIESGFRITATWPIKTEAESSLNIRDRAAARSTILLVCRPKTEQTAGSSSWEEVEKKVVAAVRERLPQLEQYDLKPLDIYLASFGPALETISDNWPVRRELANPDRLHDPFTVTPNDALQVARREVFAARRRKISALWADNPGDPLTEFYVLARDGVGSATIPFDEANMIARCIGLELDGTSARRIYRKKGSNINLLTGQQRLAEGHISPNAPTVSNIDWVHTAVALAGHEDVNSAMDWCAIHGFQHDAPFKGTLEALIRIMPIGDPDLAPARTLWSEMYREETPESTVVQESLFQDRLIKDNGQGADAA